MFFGKLKKLVVVLGITMIATAMCSGIFTAQAKVVYSDVPDDYLYKNAIYSLLYDGVMEGKKQPDNTYIFRPNSTVTKADAAMFIVNAIVKNDAELLETSNKYSDVPVDHPANKYITYATQTGIVWDNGDGKFLPDVAITYGEMVKMLVLASDAGSRCKKTTPWYDGYINVATELGITKDITYAGDKNVSRGVAAQLICNFLNEKTLPRLFFTGDMTGMNTKDDERKIHVSYRSSGLTFAGYAKIKLQGTSSLAYNKKNFTINFYSTSSYNEKKKIDFGWGEQSKYCLKANWIDKTHARNVVTAKLVTQMQEKYGVLNNAPANGAVDGFPVEIYINNAYHGLYTLNIPKDEWMFNMDSDNPDNIVVSGEGWEPAALFKAMPNFDMWDSEVGENNSYTLGKMNRLFSFVINSTDDEFKKNFEEYMSLDAALNYYVMSDVAYLSDNLGKNMLLATYDGKKWYPCLYDLDSSWGANTGGDGLMYYEQNLVGANYNRLFKRLEKCFSKELAQRYFDLRSDVLSKNNIMFKFDSFTGSIPEISYARELVTWGPYLPGFGISQIEDYLDNMLPRLDEKYGKWK